MATMSEAARDELVQVIAKHIGVLRVLADRQEAVLYKNALREVVHAYEQYDAAWQANQRMQQQVRS